MLRQRRKRAKGRVGRSLLVPVARGERAVWDRPLVRIFNDRSGDISRVAAKGLLRMRGNAASAVAATAQVRFVRTVSVHALCSEGQVFPNLR